MRRNVCRLRMMHARYRWMRPCGATRAGTQAPPLPTSIKPLCHATSLILVHQRTIRRRTLLFLSIGELFAGVHFLCLSIGELFAAIHFLCLSIGELFAGIHFLCLSIGELFAGIHFLFLSVGELFAGNLHPE